MTPEEENAASDTEAAEETQGEPEETPTPTLNRAQRRAMAKGKKSAPDGANPAARLARNQRGSGGHAPNAHGQSYLPRTGHK